MENGRKTKLEEVMAKMNYVTAKNELVQRVVSELSLVMQTIQDEGRDYIYPNNRSYNKANECSRNDQDIIDEMADAIPEMIDYILKF